MQETRRLTITAICETSRKCSTTGVLGLQAYEAPPGQLYRRLPSTSGTADHALLFLQSIFEARLADLSRCLQSFGRALPCPVDVPA